MPVILLEEDLERFDVAGDPGHDPAGLLIGEEVEREPLDHLVSVPMASMPEPRSSFTRTRSR